MKVALDLPFFSPIQQMAKGLRSKIKRKHKATRRSEIYGPAEAARALRLAEKTRVALQGVKSEIVVDSPRDDSCMQVDSKMSVMTKMEKARLMLSRNQYKKLVLKQKKEKRAKK